jgi:hypothetical protein
MSRELDKKERVALRVPTGEDRQRRLNALKRELIAAAKGPASNLSMEDVRKKGRLAVLRKLAGRTSIRPSFDC